MPALPPRAAMPFDAAMRATPARTPMLRYFPPAEIMLLSASQMLIRKMPTAAAAADYAAAMNAALSAARSRQRAAACLHAQRQARRPLITPSDAFAAICRCHNRRQYDAHLMLCSCP